jgi:hypothetical protein
MPVDVLVNGKLQTVPMSSGRGALQLPSTDSIVTVDPDSKILRQSDAIDRFRADPASKIPYGTS